jgi:hypothetical protein
MARPIALFAACLVTALTVSTTCFAGVADGLAFTIQPSGEADRVHVDFSSAVRGTSRWSSSFPTRDLPGLDVARLRSAGSGPIRFELTREAGRLACAGLGGERRGVGTCRFTADPSFTAFLASRGIGRPNADQAFSLMAVNARRSVVAALSDARYPMPSINDLIPLVAVGVDSNYIAGLAAAGYRPPNLDSLLQFKALGISPAFIRTFRQLGYDNLRPGELVQLKALGIDGRSVAEFDRLGYRKLAIGDLVQLKALGVTPDFVLDLRRHGYRDLSVSKLVHIKALGLAPGGARRADGKNRAR